VGGADPPKSVPSQAQIAIKQTNANQANKLNNNKNKEKALQVPVSVQLFLGALLERLPDD
jgi:hypothetical protein